MLNRRLMLLEYLKKIFGEPAVKECNLNLRWLPLYLSNTYRFYGISIYNKSYAFALPQSTLNLKSYKVQEKKAEVVLSVPVVLCVDKLMFQQRENLINSGVEFVEPGKQIYMPSLGVVLNDKRNSADTKPIEKFTPQIQLCALFFLYKKEKEYTAKEISETTGLNVMAVSRGVSALTELELLLVRKAARTNYYTIKASKNKFLESIKDYLISPVLKRVYADGKTIFNVGIKSGYTALSQLTSVVDDSIQTYAVSRTTFKSIESNCRESSDMFSLNDKIVKIEVWRYDPMIFMVDNCVDRLSLYLSFAKDNDERTEESLEELMKEINNG